ncbi:metabotropic glutamate receptor 3-like [Dendronephthya gigantea]|uniref:metabotropic glutamate receptor 3-like n=1 Tax=Dendronephthya gigantea TaxID=151771 RepID=UPI00106A6329|nr:metabotropic glutamate receptor 3-like [Dendronephthya gigantea]
MASRLQFLTLVGFCLIGHNFSKEEALQTTIKGNVTLGGLFPIHFPGEDGTCSVFNSLRAIQEIEAFLFAVDQINANETLLPNVTLGVKAFDTCGDATSALNSAVKEFVLGKHWNTEEHCTENERQVVGVIGPGYSSEAVHITPFLNLFEIPLISYSATSPVLSDKKKYEYFSRTATSDMFQIPAIIDLLVLFNWTYVSVLYSDETYGQTGYKGLKEEGEKRGIYFANEIKEVQQTYDKNKYKKIVVDVLSKTEATVIILFGVDNALEPILNMIQKAAGNRSLLFVCSDALASAIYEELNKVRQITQQVIFFNLPTGQVDGFTEYFLNLSVEKNKRNPWFKDFFESFMNCSFDDQRQKLNKTKCNPNQTLSDTDYSDQVENFTQSVPLVVDAVYAFAHALTMFSTTCQRNRSEECKSLKKMTGNELLKVLRDEVFWSPSGNLVNFSKEGDVMGVYNIYYSGKVGGKKYEYSKIGHWKGFEESLQFDDLEWKAGFRPLKSSCETFCTANQYRKTSKKPRQCWECEDCEPGSYAVNETGCQKCPKGEKPDHERKSCVEIIPTYLSVDGKLVPSSVVILPMVVSSIGIVAVLFVFGNFMKHWNTPVVKASGRELSTLLLIGVLLAFVFPFVAISNPSPVKCFWQFVLGSLPFTVCFVAIVVKNNRTYRIFNPNRVITAQPSLIRPKSQILVSLGLIAFQLILLSALISLEFPEDKMTYPSAEKIVHVCLISERQMFLSHLYNIVLLAACTYYGYKTKNIPRNFNEAKHIAFAMYGACVSMVAFGVVFFFNSEFSSNYGVVIEMMHHPLVGFIIITCFFAPKIYIILMKPEQNAHTMTVGTEIDVTRAREHRRSRHQFPASDRNEFAECDTKVECSTMNVVRIK